MDALIGATGFVGGNLQQQHAFGALFGSRNVAEIHGHAFDTVVCAAAPAVMWLANKEPEKDAANLRSLIGHLEKVRADRFVLISTIAVLDDPASGYDEGTAQYEHAKAYGRNRRMLEEACAEIFPQCSILRLPALYGEGLKKNFLFDVLNPAPSFLPEAKFVALRDDLPPDARAALERIYAFDAAAGAYGVDRARLDADPGAAALTAALDARGATALQFTNPESRFQYYGLHALWDDIGRCLQHELPVMHLATAPLAAGEVYRALTGGTLAPNGAAIYAEDMRTGHAGLWGATPPYIQTADQVLEALRAFYRAQAR